MHRERLFFVILLFCLVSLFIRPCFAADDPDKIRLPKKQQTLVGPIVDNNVKWHTIGKFWNRVTNYGKLGDDTYGTRTPSGDWPGGSGNSYLYRASIWLTAKVDGVPHSTNVEDSEFAPLDSVHVITGPNAVSDEDMYTRYYDVMAPEAEGHFPLGVEVTERSFAWRSNWADDFIIYEYTVKNVGIDTNEDGYPDKPRDLTEFYFTFRLDADVSRIGRWANESIYTDADDITYTNVQPWDDWFKLFPKLANRPHTLTAADLDSSMVYMFDADNPSYPAENNVDDDFGNPGPDGTLLSPGIIGFKVLKTDPPMHPHSFYPLARANDPDTDTKVYNMIAAKKFQTLPIKSKIPYVTDYRGILTYGPIPKFAAGDSFKLTAALGIGCDPDSGGVYSMMEFVKIMKNAQFIVDMDYKPNADQFTPPTPIVEVETRTEGNKVTGVRVIWDDAAASHPYFEGYKVWRSAGRSTTGEFIWQPLGKGIYSILDGPNWQPPTGTKPGTFELVDDDVINGYDYYYAVQAYSKELVGTPFDVIETSLLAGTKNITPATPVASTLDNVKVVPNPYIGSAIWNNAMPSNNSPWQHRLQFINLPADATVKIFTLDGDFIDEVHAGGTVRQGTGYTGEGPASVAEWDLITRNNQEAAPGMYMYVVDSPTLGTKIGKFIIIQ